MCMPTIIHTHSACMIYSIFSLQNDIAVLVIQSQYRPFSGGVVSRLATAIYVAMVTPILHDNSYGQKTQISNMKVISLMVDFIKFIKLRY